MALTESQIQELYVAYFGRPADVEGKSYWSGSTTGVSTTLEFAANMHSQSEFQDAYGSKTAATQVNEIYQNLFGRDADADGLAYWTGQIGNETLKLAEIAVHLIWAAKNNAGGTADKTALENKVAAATAFTADVEADATAQLAYTADDPTAFATAKAALAGITSTAATDAEIDAVVLEIKEDYTKNIVTGSTYNFTTAADDFTGTANNDIFKGVVDPALAASNTFTSTDSIAGGAGTDVLDVTFALQAGNTAPLFPTGTISSVENFKIRNLDNDAGDTKLTVDFGGISGEKLVQNNVSTGALKFDNLASGTDAEIIGNAATTNGATEVDYVAAATSAKLGFVDGTTGTGAVTTTGTKLTSQTFTSTGAANTIGALGIAATVTDVTIDAATKLTTGTITATKGATLTVTGSGAVDLNSAALPATFVTIDGSASTGDIDLAAGAVAKQAAEADAAITIKTGSGNDEITTSAIAADRHISINAGAGDDLIVTSSNGAGQVVGVSSSGVYGDVIDGGAGTDVLSVSSVAAGAQAATTSISNIEELTISNALTAVTVTTKNFQSGLSIVNLDAGSSGAGTIAFEAGSNTIDLKLALGAKLTVSAAGDATTDSLTINNVGGTAGAGNGISALGDQNLDLNGIETFTYNSTGLAGSGAETQLVQAIDLSGVSTGGTATVNFTGTNAVTLKASTGIISAEVVDASALGGALVMNDAMESTAAATGSATLTGTAKADTLKGDTGEASTINGGAGNDKITGGSAKDTINAGEGNDTIYASAGKDVINGEAGIDTINLGAASQTIDAGAGNDTVNAAGNLAYGQSIKGGEGVDVLITSGAVASNAAGDVVSGFEFFEFGGNFTQDLAMFANNTFTEIGLGGRTAHVDGVVNEKIVVNAALAGDSSADLKDATGTADSINIRLEQSQSTNFTNLLTVAGIETVNIESQNTHQSATNISHAIDLVAAAATTLTLTGNAGLAFEVGGGKTQDVSKVTTLDASGMSIAKATYAGVTFAVSNATANAAVSITGSGGEDTITGGNVTNDTISGGAGVDTITYLGGRDTYTGGAGKDNFLVEDLQDNTTADFLTIADFTAGDTLDLSSGVTLDFDDATTGLGAAVSLGAGATFTDLLNEAAKTTDNGAAISVTNGVTNWFNFDGNTYLVVDSTNQAVFTNASDLMVKFTGVLDFTKATVAAGSETLTMV